MSSNNAFLVGFMGSGKSSILKHISQTTEINTVDLDQVVLNDNSEHVETIEEIFVTHGEKYFRSQEEKSFANIENLSKTLISLGGGSLESTAIRTIVHQSKQSFYLQNEFINLWENIKNTNRPLVATGIDNVKMIYNERLESYEQCSNTIDMSTTSLQEASKIIVRKLGWV